MQMHKPLDHPTTHPSLEPRKKIYVVCGTHEQYTNYCWKKQHEGSTAKYIYVNSVDILRGLSEIEGVYIGTWRYRPDIEEIKQQISIIKFRMNYWRNMTKIEFLNLPTDERLKLIELHHSQTRIRNTSDYIKQELESLNRQYRENQELCTHPNPKMVHVESNGEKPEYSTNYYCSDCDKRWTKKSSL